MSRVVDPGGVDPDPTLEKIGSASGRESGQVPEVAGALEERGGGRRAGGVSWFSLGDYLPLTPSRTVLVPDRTNSAA